MIDLHSVVAFLHKANLPELAITHEINHVLVENTMRYSAVVKYIRAFTCGPKQTDPHFSPESAGDFILDHHITRMLFEDRFFQSAKLPRT
jgi:hypothetical protein